MICVVCEDPERPVEPGWLVCVHDYWRTVSALRAIPGLCAELASLGFVQRDRRPALCSTESCRERGVAATTTGRLRVDGRPAADGVPYCDRCARVLEEGGVLLDPKRRGIWPADPVALALTAGPINGASRQPRVAGAREAPVPIRIDPTDLLAPARPGSVGVKFAGDWWLNPAHEDQAGQLAVATELEAVARDWAGERNEGRPSPQVPVLCGWLGDRLDWAATSYANFGEDAATISRLYRVLMAATGSWEARPETLVTPCRSCGLLALYRLVGPADGEDRVACGACPALLTEVEYAEHVKGLIEAKENAA